MTLSVVVSDSTKTNRVSLLSELAGIDYQIVESLDDAEAEYVTIVNEDAEYSPGFFFRSLHVFLSKPKYKKLAMIAPVISDGDNSIYGYTHTVEGLEPLGTPSSRNPYLVQTAPIQGAVVRRSAMKGHESLSTELSQAYCLSIWENGMRVMLNPLVVYRISQISHPEFLGQPSNNLVTEWKREMI